MERQEIINYARIGTDIFLIIVIGLLCFQFFHAEELVKNIALQDNPIKLVTTYENITNTYCSCNPNSLKVTTFPRP